MIRAVIVALALAGCGPTMTEQEAAAITQAHMAAAPPADAAVREEMQRLALIRERRAETQAQLFGIEWRQTRIAMTCDDPEIRRVAYATAALQDRYYANMIRTRPTLAQISAHEDTRATALTWGVRPNAAQCRTLLRVMGESAKGMRDGER